MTLMLFPCSRFAEAVRDFTRGEVKQAHNRSIGRMPSSEEFILMRRATIGGAMVEGLSKPVVITVSGLANSFSTTLTAMVEYSLDLDIPDNVMKHPTVRALCDAACDAVTWPNVC
jgi:hypothetical protein